MDLETLIRDRLAAVSGIGGRDDIDEIARTMVRGNEFQDAKHAFGSEGSEWPTIDLPIPGLHRDARGPDILNGVLKLRRSVCPANCRLSLVWGEVELIETKQARLAATIRCTG